MRTGSRNLSYHLFKGLFGLVLCVNAAPALAQDSDFGGEDDFTFDSEPTRSPPAESKSEKPAKADKQAADAPAPAPDAPPEEPTDDDEVLGSLLDDPPPTAPSTPATPATPEESTFLDNDSTVAQDVAAPGADTAPIYRAKLRELEGVGADDEIMAWESYLQTYPNSMFKPRIQARIDELYDQVYNHAAQGSAVDNTDTTGAPQLLDLRKREINLVTGLRIPNLNPRRRIQVGGLFGYPLHIQAWADVEWALLRKLSIHGGVWGRYQGWGLEFGLRGSPVKSGKDQVVLTPALDLRLNFGPLGFTVRPQLGVGKIFGDRVQLLANFGAAITAQKTASVAIFGDLHLSVRVAQPVAIFVEAGAFAEQLGRSQGAFVFGDAMLGLRFFPKLKKRDDTPLQIDAAGLVRTASRYLGYYQGAVAVQGVYDFNSTPKH